MNNVRNALIKVCDITLTPCGVALKKSQTQKNSCERIVHLFKRIICGVIAITIFPITLAALTVKWILTPSQTDQIKQKRKNKIEKPLRDQANEKPIENEKQAFSEQLDRDMRLSQQKDLKLGEPRKGTWRDYGKRLGEKYQTFAEFSKHEEPNERLEVFKIGQFTETDYKILAITVDYLNHFHHVETHLHDKDLTFEEMKEKYKEYYEQYLQKDPTENLDHYNYKMNQLKNFSRVEGNLQYNADVLIDMMNKDLRPKVDHDGRHHPVLAFTNEDLYHDDMNFIFGRACFSGTGVYSKAHFGNPEQSPKDFERTLLRMMKIAAHEFGHMYGIDHCTDYECNIGGYMSLVELDARPLLYCSEDSAKICFSRKISMTDYYHNLLHYFENFNSKYGLNCDFSKEIQTLKDRISVLKP